MMKRPVLVILVFVLGMGQGVVWAGSNALPDLPSLPALPSLPSLPELPALSVSSSGALDKSLSSPSLASLPVSMSYNSSLQSSNLDTADIVGKDAQGSWWKKRHWLLKAREQQEKINVLVSAIQDVGCVSYDSKRASFNQAVAAFYETNAVGRGQIDQLLDQLSPYFNQPTQSDDTKLVDKDMARLASSKKFQDYFDNTVLFAQLKADLQAIVDIDAGVADRVTQFEKCSQQALQKAAEAQSAVNEMFAMVNHEKARESYYKLEGMATYLEALLKFVKTDLAADLDKLIGLGRTKMDDVSKAIANVRAACEALKKTDPTSGDAVKKLDSSDDGAKPDHGSVAAVESSVVRKDASGKTVLQEGSGQEPARPNALQLGLGAVLELVGHFFSWIIIFLSGMFGK